VVCRGGTGGALLLRTGTGSLVDDVHTALLVMLGSARVLLTAELTGPLVATACCVAGPEGQRLPRRSALFALRTTSQVDVCAGLCFSRIVSSDGAGIVASRLLVSAPSSRLAGACRKSAARFQMLVVARWDGSQALPQWGRDLSAVRLQPCWGSCEGQSGGVLVVVVCRVSR